ncbi:amidohydrolase [Puniceibacterium sp. IMCC21224]|uniref:amidohydrolase family protein n=1 Tax=Puniceibacterium sp. IMCC21224 TaxID=1618204 RepID=UPI00065D5FC3|nr:amidohydrolase family protein [Puniceibacterium sp. IMCC21224]KMK65166.1 putative TIM-barrel fold metal-dependent hydrolase [Puniceibacterium sp. IMCC21224]
MVTKYIDIHPHIISGDQTKYPPSPLFGKQSDWSKERPLEVQGLLDAMNAAGVGKAAIVHSSTCYGYDNSYVCDSVLQHPDRLTAVGSVDLKAPDATQQIKAWMKRGLTGLRLFTGGSTKAFDTSDLDDPASFPAWDLAGQEGLSICIQTGPVGLAQIAGLAKRFPKVNIILDHLSRPVVEDGPPYNSAVSLWAMSAFDNIYMKITPRTTDLAVKGSADPTSLFTKLVETFGAERLAWGSNYPSSDGELMDNLDVARQQMSFLPEAVQRQIFAGTAQKLYPCLADAKVAAE